MKPQNKTPLSLKKQAVSKLTNAQQANLQAGNAATTSFIQCSGFSCCDPTESVTIITQIFNCLPQEDKELTPGG